MTWALLRYAVLALLLASPALAAPVTKGQLLELADSRVDVDLVVQLVNAQCVDFELDAEALLELAPAVDKRILQAIFECQEGAESRPVERAPEDGDVAAEGTGPERAREPAVAAEAAPPNPTAGGDTSPCPAAANPAARIAVLRVTAGKESGYLELFSDRLAWSRKEPGERSKSKPTVVAYEDVLEFQPTLSHKRGNPTIDRRGGLFIRISDGRSWAFDPVGDANARVRERYTPEKALQLAGTLNDCLAIYRSARRLTPETYEAREFAVAVKSEKDGTFSFRADRIEFEPRNEAARERFGFSILFSRVTEVRLGGWGEAAIGFDQTRPLEEDERIDLGVRNGWIALNEWEGKGLVRELENRGIETRLEWAN